MTAIDGDIDGLLGCGFPEIVDVSPIRCFNTSYDICQLEAPKVLGPGLAHRCLCAPAEPGFDATYDSSERRRATGPGRSRSADIARQRAGKRPACRRTEGTNHPTASASWPTLAG